MQLVSVIISSYNSSQFIIETLLSVSNQTWTDIELIITDDCSEDDTVNLCRKWLNENGVRFVRTELLRAEKNCGVASNANRGLKIAKGDWIKFLGADDTLKTNCIEDNMQWIKSHPSIRVLFSKIDVFNNKFESDCFIETTIDDSCDTGSIMSSERSPGSQYKMLLIADRIHYTPSVFLHRETLISVGGFDERFKMLEDYPLWLNLTRNGHKLYFMDKVTVNYRQHSKALNNTGISFLVNPNYFKMDEFRKVYTYPNIPLEIRLYQQYNYLASQIFRRKWINKDNKATRLLLNILTVYLNPFLYYIHIKKRLVKNLKDLEFYV